MKYLYKKLPPGIAALIAGTAVLALAGCQHQTSVPTGNAMAAGPASPQQLKQLLAYPGRKMYKPTNQMTTPSNLAQ